MLTLYKTAILEAQQAARTVADNARVKLRQFFSEMANDDSSNVASAAHGELESSSDLLPGPEAESEAYVADQSCLIGFDIFGSK